MSGTDNSHHGPNSRHGPNATARPHHGSPPGRSRPPELLVTGGSLPAAELAAVTVVVTARVRLAGQPAPGPVTRSEWSAVSRLVREPLVAHRGGWRASGLPR